MSGRVGTGDETSSMAEEIIEVLRRAHERGRMMELIRYLRASGSAEVELFLEYLRRPWMADRRILFVMEVFWVSMAAVSLLIGMYFFTPPYVFLSSDVNMTDFLTQVVAIISANPQIVNVISPVLSVLGLSMIFISIYSLYQVYVIRRQLPEGEEYAER